MSQTHTFDAAQHLFSFSGILIANGFGPDSFLKITRASDTFSYTSGASGEGAYSKSNDKSGTVELTLLASSQANDQLAAVAELDELSGVGTAPLFIKEANGTMRAHAQNARIMKQPDIERGKEIGTTTWVFHCADLEMLSGGLL